MTPSSKPTSKPRVLSGMRPTGKLHLGNYVGALANWVKLQDEGKYDCFFFVADWHALTTDYADTSGVKQNSIEVLLDWLAAGLDPEKSTIFIQSHVPQHAELHLLFSMVTPLGWLERVPTYKEQRENIQEKDLGTYGFLGYPVLQAADILIYQAQYVPVGEDQVAHVELTREIARRFNQFYPLGKLSHRIVSTRNLGKADTRFLLQQDRQIQGDSDYVFYEQQKHPRYGMTYVFPEPQTLLTESPKLRGTDRRKMSKSYNNFILLSDPANVVEEKIRLTATDRPRMEDHGDPDRCPIGDLHKIFNQRQINDVYVGCRGASISCRECKSWAIEALLPRLQPMREKRKHYEQHPELVSEVIASGAAKASAAANRTMRAVRTAIGLLPRRRTSLKLRASPVKLNFAAIMHLAPEQRGDERRRAWLDYIAREHPLRFDRPKTYITKRNKRVAVVTAGQGTVRPDEYHFLLRDGSYELLALLGHRKDNSIIDFILPQSFFRNHWRNFPRDGDTEKVLVRIRERKGHFELLTAEGPEIPINEFRAAYQYLD